MCAVYMGLYGRPCSFSWAIYSLSFYNRGECVVQYFVSWGVGVGVGGLEVKFGISRLVSITHYFLGFYKIAEGHTDIRLARFPRSRVCNWCGGDGGVAGGLPDTVVGTQDGVGILADTDFRDTDAGKRSSSWGG